MRLPAFPGTLATPRPRRRRRAAAKPAAHGVAMAAGRWYGLRRRGWYARCVRRMPLEGWAFPYRCLVFRPGPNGRLLEDGHPRMSLPSYTARGRYLVFADSPYDAVRELRRCPRGAPAEYRP